MSTSNWSDHDFEELLRRASELERNQQDSRSSLFKLRAAFNASRAGSEAAQPARVWDVLRLALWSVVILGAFAAVFVLVRMLLKA
jgi:hypothetical protein